MALIKFDNFELNEAMGRDKIKNLVDELYNRSNIVHFMMDSGIMDRNGKIKKELTIEDLLSNMNGEFEVHWKNIDEAEGEFIDLISACKEIAALHK